MAKTNAVWGVDIGQCALKALRCTISPDGETIVADKYDYIEYPKILSQPEADPQQLVKEALEQFLSRNSVVGDQVAISVSGQAGLSRFFKPPPVEVKMLPDIVKYEVKQQIPFPIEDVIWDWQQLGGTIIDGRAVDAEVGLFAMKRDAVFEAMQPFNDVDVDVDYIQLSPLSIFNVVCHDRIENLPNPEEFDPENPPDSIVVLSIGTDTTDLIVTNGIKLWLRSIPIGGNHFTKKLSSEMKLTQTKAEHLKRNARASENPKAIFKAMRPVFNDLVGEVQRSLTFYQSMEKSANLSEIVLLGNAAKLPGLRQYLNKQLEIDIAKVTEFKKLEGNDVVKQPTFANNVLSFASCYGLCLQALNKGRINTNLLPKEIVVERIIEAKKPWVLAAVGALTLGLVCGLWGVTNAWWHVNDEYTDSSGFVWKQSMTRVNDEKNKSSRLVGIDEELKKKLDQLNMISEELSSASENKATWLEFYFALSQAFPKDPAIEASKEANGPFIDPSEIPFEDRKELYIDYIESVYFADLNEWFSTVKQIHRNAYDRVNAVFGARNAAAEPEDPNGDQAPQLDANSTAAAAEFLSAGNEEISLDGVSGWVIEIKGHHFHNSAKADSTYNSMQAYLTGTLTTALKAKKDVVIPGLGADERFTFSDIGVSFPTAIKFSSESQPRTIVFDPTSADGESAEAQAGRGNKFGKGGGGMGAGSPGEGAGGEGGGTSSSSAKSNDSDSELKFEVNHFDFVVQLAWTPRSHQEIFAARAERLKSEADAAAVRDAAEAKAEVD